MPDPAEVTIFICANCARPGIKPTSSGRCRPVVPDFKWPCSAQQVIVPCAGRLQPEHILKAFEAGSTIVSVVACREDNCHYIEGSRRCALRMDYIQSILKEIGLGEERLVLSHLPGSASEDLALASGKAAAEKSLGASEEQVSAIRDEVMHALRMLPPNPLRMLSQKAELEKDSEEEMVPSGVAQDE
ncbi:MAG: hydrogenase iron-sulfur subunit [Acidobacteria bacterium]|nr:hydrogenase iron-sulfur subunit [Acidobacteriota bacterium]